MNTPPVGARLRMSVCIRLLSTLICGSAFAVSPLQGLANPAAQAGSIVEPKTPGIFYLLDAQGSETSLEFKVARASTIVVSVEGAQSPVRVADGSRVRLLVRLPEGVDAAAAGIGFFEFEPKNDHRSIEFEAFKQPRRLKRPPMAVVGYDSTPVGSSSIVMTPKTPLGAGEYCLGIGKNSKDAYCFGVDGGGSDGGGASAVAQGAGQAASGVGMTNADVLKMVGAGLSPDVVISSIRGSSAHNFDLSIDGLIALKKAKVPDAVVVAMQQPPTGGGGGAAPVMAGVGSAPAPPAGGFTGAVPDPPDESTFYYVTAAGKLGKLEKLRADRILEAELSHRNETGWKVYGAKSGVRLPNGNVTVLVKLYKKVFIFEAGHEEDIRFRRWEPLSGARETWYNMRPPNRYRAKTLEQGEFEFTAAKTGENTYKITPNEPLIPGEYCISTGDFHTQFCFGVDGR